MGIDAEMLVVVNRKVTTSEIEKLRYDIVEAFGANEFFIVRPEPTGYFKNGRHALEVVETFEQDGPTLTPQKGETFIRVSLGGRYYGEGYERGHLPSYAAIAEWLEIRLPECKVFYGGDSSGVVVEPFGSSERRKLFEHFAKFGHKPYTGNADEDPGFRETLGSNDGIKTPVCEFCNRRTIRYGFGQNYAAFTCNGCGWQQVTRDGGKTFTEPKKDELF